MKMPTKLTQLAGKQSLAFQQNQPKLLFVGGVAGVIGSTVLACRATLKLDEVLADTQNDMAVANEMQKREPEKYTPSDLQHDKYVIVAKGAGNVAKLYAPSVIGMSLSIAALTKSHNLLQERNAALAAAYSALDKAFTRYRQKVVENYGEDVDRDLFYEVEQTTIEDEKGKKRKVTTAAPGAETLYARFFDNGSQYWDKDNELNLVFLKTQQTYWNHMLNARGYVFLNEVYKELGIPITKAGQVVGWVTDGDGDGYIDFGVFDETNAKARDFVNGREASILLDFNVDGPILNRINDSVEETLWRK